MAAKTKPSPQKPAYFKDLMLLFAIPASIALIAALAVYVPKLLTNPKYDFIYAACGNYDCDGSYSVDGAGEVYQNRPTTTLYGLNSGSLSQTQASRLPELRYYDVKTDSSRALSLSDAQHYKLDTSSRSPDGYVLTDADSSSGFLFWGNYESGWYLKDGAKKQKVELGQAANYGYNSGQITFVGWVKQ